MSWRSSASCSSSAGPTSSSALVLHWMAVGLRHQPRLSPAAHAPRVQDLEGVRVFPGGLRHADARGRTDLLGGHPPRAPSALGSRRRSAHAARRRLLGARRLDPLRRYPPQQHGADGEVRARPCRRPVLPLAEHVPLRAARRGRASPARRRRLAAGALGHLPARGRRPARHLAGELRDPHVGHAAGSRRATTPATAGGSRS